MESIEVEASISRNHHDRRYVFPVIPLLILLFGLCSSSSATDILSQNETLTGNQTLISIGEIFEFGFFNLEGRSYLGIWYYDIQPRTVIWVANRDEPFDNFSGFVGFRSGKLVVIDGVDTSSVLWSMRSRSDTAEINLTAEMKDEGNLVVSLQQDGTEIWGSFDSPTDTFLPGQMLILDSSDNELTTFRPWKSDVDPSPGNFSLFLDPRKYSSYYQYVIVDSRKTQISANSTSMGDGDVILWRSGPWSVDMKVFNGLSQLTPMGASGYNLVAKDNGNRIEFSLTLQTSSVRMRFVLLANGTLTTYVFADQERQWGYTWSQPADPCDFYNHCGENAMCTVGSEPRCRCLFGFKPSLGSEWNKGNWSGGCIRNTTITDCQRRDVGFMNLTNVKTPDLQTFYRVVNQTSERLCRTYCLNNCSCVAYVFMNNDGCYTWSGALFDLLNLTTISMGANLSIKLNKSDLPPPASDDSGNGLTVVAIVVPIIGATIFVVFSIFVWNRHTSKSKRVVGKIKMEKKKKKTPLPMQSSNRSSLSLFVDEELSGEQRSSTDLLLLNFEIIQTATNDFNESNTLGKGGFGHVYKGVLPGGVEVAVKRLSESSFQGLEELKNEMILIAKLQHKNLVRMHGVCIEGNEKILVYEYMPNKSLDDFIFNPEKQHLLDWRSRSDIIEGVARGLLYLHRDSRLNIVHRDLKAANILLDEEMNPKISDFGMARIFGGNQNDEKNTNRVVGTFGYMSPEYAMEGLFSVKSDVYSFGVVILEIICGVKINRFQTDNHTNLLGHAWQLWIENRGMELVDSNIKRKCSEEEVLRYEHVALLCVQDRPMDRPTMSSVVLMLGTESPIQSIPKKPAFTVANRLGETQTEDTAYGIYGEILSQNEITFTDQTIR